MPKKIIPKTSAKSPTKVITKKTPKTTTVAKTKIPAKKTSSKKKTVAKPWIKTKKTASSSWLKISTAIAKLNPSGKKLLIVESPGKVKTISKYLGSDYVVKASVGHIVDLIDKNMNKLVEKEFEPEYEIDPDKRKVVSELRSVAKASSQVILATDEDREGEAIAYHLTMVLGLDPLTTPRIVFNEITKSAIEDAIEHPRYLDMDLIFAQKSRAVLDRLVWFTVSPILWQKIKMGLSAGRVQSVAVKLVVEKEREIQNFQPVEYWVLKAILGTTKGEVEIVLKKVEWVDDIEETAEGEESKDSKNEKEKMTSWRFSKSALDKILEQLWVTKAIMKLDDKTWFQVLSDKTPIEFQLFDIITKQSKKSPPPPFITSSLQQTASRLFGWPVKQVMSAAQKLYEAWLITYMRTDSTSLSGQAIAQFQSFIKSRYWEKYSTVRQYKSKSKNAQEAHEAIRPTNIEAIPEEIKLGQYEQRLYNLIRRRALASQMSDALFTNTSYVFYPLI